jgi:hypothetical protein
MHGRVLSGRSQRETDGQIGRGLAHREPTGRGYEGVSQPDGKVLVLGQNADDEGHAARIETDRDPPRLIELGLRNESLYLDQDRPGSFQTGEHDGTGDPFVPIGEQHRRGIGHDLEPVRVHGENPGLVARTEPVLGRAQQAESSRALAFEIKNDIHHVLERLGAGHRTFLGHMTDHDDHR